VEVTGAWWVGTLAAVSLLLVVDLIFAGRRRRRPSPREAALGVLFYSGTAIVFGSLVWRAFGARYGGEFAAGWLTEYSLSVDNLFVFMVLMSRFAVPSSLQLRVLTIGIVLALMLRGTLIAAGSAAIAAFSWVFYLFGAFLLGTAWKLLREGPGGEEAEESTKLVSLLQRHLRTTRTWADTRLTVRENGRRVLTPMLVVMIAIGVTDVLFALDSIPAIFGLTKEPFLVVSANAFALMGLRQLYFLVGDLLDRLVHLAHGLAVVLGFIAVKLILEALHENDLPFVNGGQPVAWAPQIPVWASLGFVIGTLAVTAITSLISDRVTSSRTTAQTATGGIGGGAVPLLEKSGAGAGAGAGAQRATTQSEAASEDPARTGQVPRGPDSRRKVDVPTPARLPSWGARASAAGSGTTWPLRFHPTGDGSAASRDGRSTGSQQHNKPPQKR
jgi:tellurite resistance protein TerC